MLPVRTTSFVVCRKPPLVTATVGVMYFTRFLSSCSGPLLKVAIKPLPSFPGKQQLVTTAPFKLKLQQPSKPARVIDL